MLTKKDKTDLKQYDSMRFNRPSVAVDITVFTVQDQQLKVLLIQRGAPPFEGKWALPGGFLNKAKDKSLDDAVLRELQEETGAIAPYIEQLYTFGNADRDPRDWTVSVAYFALIAVDKVNLRAGSDAQSTKWWAVRGSKVNAKLAFDHGEILSMAVARLRSKLEYTAIAGYLLGDEFTLPHLQSTYEIILGVKLDKTAFRRNLQRAKIVRETKRMEERKAHRPAKYYQFTKTAKNTLFFPRSILRSTSKI
jgi:8-oxo-dGTP diphosphatase